MKPAIASIIISITFLVSSCAVIEPARTIAVTHMVEACTQPSGKDWTKVYEDKEGACTWQRNMECYIQTPRKTYYKTIGNAIRACLN